MHVQTLPSGPKKIPCSRSRGLLLAVSLEEIGDEWPGGSLGVLQGAER